MNLSLTGDGLVENLYHYVWAKDHLFRTSPDINLPDTVIYRYEQPAFWYFSSDKPPLPHLKGPRKNIVLRKNKVKLTNAEIEKVFLRRQPASGIVAVYIYNKKERNIVNVMNQQQKEEARKKEEEERGIAVETEEEAQRQGMTIHNKNLKRELKTEGETCFEYFNKE